MSASEHLPPWRPQHANLSDGRARCEWAAGTQEARRADWPVRAVGWDGAQRGLGDGTG